MEFIQISSKMFVFSSCFKVVVFLVEIKPNYDPFTKTHNVTFSHLYVSIRREICLKSVENVNDVISSIN